MKFYTSVHRHMNNIHVRGYDSKKRFKETIRYSPTLYVYNDQSNDDLKTLEGYPVSKQQFETISKAKEFIETYSSSNMNIYGTTNYIHQFIAHNYPGKIEYDQNLIRIHTIDIECTPEEGQFGFPKPEKAEHPITAIGIHDSIDNKYYVWSTANWNRSNSVLLEELKIEYNWFETESELLKSFISFWYDEFTCPDIVTGWNIRTFDIPYIVNRIGRILGDTWVKKLSPWKQIDERMISIQKKQVQSYDIAGIAQLDYLDLFKKFAYTYGTQESYKLDHIAHVVLGEKKLSYDEYGSLRNLYHDNPQLFVDYNVKDVQLCVRFEDKLGLIAIACSMIYKAGTTFNDVFGTTAIWDALIHKYLLEQNIVVPPNKHSIKREFEGAYVKEPIVGMHDWVCSFDVASLYPNIIVQWNMSPETILFGERQNNVSVQTLLDGKVKCERDDATLAATGQYFSKSKQGFLPKIIEELYDERLSIKKKMLEAKQKKQLIDKNNKEELFLIDRAIAHYANSEQTIKIFLNSCYGAISNNNFRYFYMEIAESITLTGQYIIRSAERSVNGYINNILKNNKDYIITMDTDSLYLSLNDIIKTVIPKETNENKIVDFLDGVCKKIQSDCIDKTFNSLYTAINGFKSRITMKREGIASRGVFIQKKRYMLQILDNEGVRYAEPDIKMMGIEAIKSSTPAICRDAMKDLFKIILNESEEKAQSFIASFKKDFMLSNPEDKAFPRSVSSVSSYKDKNNIYTKGTPINSRSALLYNHYIKKHGLEDKYELINDGDRIKYIYLNPQNPTREDVIGFIDVLPEEFGLHRYIDNELQFQKTFIDPVILVMDAIGWSVEEKNSLEGFFS